MKKKTTVFLLLFTLLFSVGCTGGKKEEEPVITPVSSEEADVTFLLDQNWVNETSQQGQEYDLLVRNILTNSMITVIHEDLKQTGNRMLLMEDYIETFQEGILSARDYDYECEEAELSKLNEKEYYIFSAREKTMGAEQLYCIRREEDTLIILTFTAFGEDTIDELTALLGSD